MLLACNALDWHLMRPFKSKYKVFLHPVAIEKSWQDWTSEERPGLKHLEDGDSQADSYCTVMKLSIQGHKCSPFASQALAAHAPLLQADRKTSSWVLYYYSAVEFYCLSRRTADLLFILMKHTSHRRGQKGGHQLLPLPHQATINKDTLGLDLKNTFKR